MIKCPKCGCMEFRASQSIVGSVPVICTIGDNGHTYFNRNATNYGETDVSGCSFGDPEGPFVCKQCDFGPLWSCSSEDGKKQFFARNPDGDLEFWGENGKEGK